MRLGGFLAGRVCRREGVRASPWPVVAGTVVAAGDLLGLFSLGLRRGGGVLEVLESGFLAFGVDMLDGGWDELSKDGDVERDDARSCKKSFTERMM